MDDTFSGTVAGGADEDAAERAAVTAAPALGKSVGRGATWMVLNTFFVKGASFATLAVLGNRLSRADFGLWTMAFSFAAFTQVFRDGGVAQLLIKRGEKEYRSLAGPVFWMAMVFNLAGATLLALLAPLEAHQQGEPRLKMLLWVIALAMAMSTPATVLWVRGQMQLKFGAIALTTAGSAVIRYGGMVALAWFAGMGSLSFVLPLPVISLWEGIAGYLVIRDAPWKERPQVARWPALFSEGKWLIFVAFAMAVLNQGTFFGLSQVLSQSNATVVNQNSVALLGLLFFAYQLVNQVDQVLTAVAAAVLFPALALLNDEPERQAAATLRAARMLCVVASTATLGLAVCMAPLTHLLWLDKWTEAVLPAQLLAAFYIGRVLFFVPLQALQARGLFKFSALLAITAGLGQAGVAAGAALIWGDARRIAAALAVFMAFGFVGFTVFAMKKVGVGRRKFLYETVPVWLLSCVAGAVGLGVQRWTHPLLEAWQPGRISAGVELLAVGGVFSVTLLVLLRLFAAARLREVTALAPGRLQKYLRWV